MRVTLHKNYQAPSRTRKVSQGKQKGQPGNTRGAGRDNEKGQAGNMRGAATENEKGSQGKRKGQPRKTRGATRETARGPRKQCMHIYTYTCTYIPLPFRLKRSCDVRLHARRGERVLTVWQASCGRQRVWRTSCCRRHEGVRNCRPPPSNSWCLLERRRLDRRLATARVSRLALVERRLALRSLELEQRLALRRLEAHLEIERRPAVRGLDWHLALRHFEQRRALISLEPHLEWRWRLRASARSSPLGVHGSALDGRQGASRSLASRTRRPGWRTWTSSSTHSRRSVAAGCCQER